MLLVLEVVNEDALICQKRDKPHDLSDGHFKVLGLHQLLAEVFQPAIATGDLLGGFGCEEQRVLLVTDVDNCGSFVIHCALPPLTLFFGCRGIGRLIDFLIPVRDSRSGHIALQCLRFPRVLAACVCLVAAQNGAFNGRRGEGNAVALGGKVRRRNTEFHAVQPVILVLAVGLLSTKAYRHGITAVLGCGNQHLVFVDGCTREVGCRRRADIINAKGECAGLEFLHDLRSTVIGIERSLCQFHRKVSGDGFRKLLRRTVGFLTGVILGDFCVIQSVKTDSRHNLFLQFVDLRHVNGVVVVAGFGLKADVPAVGNIKVRTKQGADKVIFQFDVTALCEERQPCLLRFAAGSVVRMKIEAVRQRCDHQIGVRGFAGEHTRFHWNTAMLGDGL
nr:MAG TPA: hypothetical protein [Caudoviricetes sp.]